MRAIGTIHGGRGADRRGGFTFVELLVAMIMLGLLAALAIPAFLGTRDTATGASAQSLLRIGATAVETASVEPEGYASVTTADLAAAEPAVSWTTAAGAMAADDAVTVSGVSATGYTLTTVAESGVAYSLVKDLTASPAVTRTCGPGCRW
jgi:type IV pilus assembly protein PilA